MTEDGEVSGYFIGFVSFAGTLGFLLNLWGTIRTWKTFNLNLARYLILFLGTSFSCFALFCTLVMFGYIFTFDDRNIFTCTFYVGWNSVASSSGSTMLSVLSIIRFVGSTKRIMTILKVYQLTVDTRLPLEEIRFKTGTMSSLLWLLESSFQYMAFCCFS